MHAYSKDPLRLAGPAAPSFWTAAAGALNWLAQTWPAKAVFALAAAVAAERRARETVLELQRWDDHMLRDIGLERMDIEAAVRGVRPPFRWQPDCDAGALDRLNAWTDS